MTRNNKERTGISQSLGRCAKQCDYGAPLRLHIGLRIFKEMLPKSYHERLVETARALEYDEDNKRFEEKLKQIAKVKPSMTKRKNKS